MYGASLRSSGEDSESLLVDSITESRWSAFRPAVLIVGGILLGTAAMSTGSFGAARGWLARTNLGVDSPGDGVADIHQSPRDVDAIYDALCPGNDASPPVTCKFNEGMMGTIRAMSQGDINNCDKAAVVSAAQSGLNAIFKKFCTDHDSKFDGKLEDCSYVITRPLFTAMDQGVIDVLEPVIACSKGGL
jgi:hypothetical protein